MSNINTLLAGSTGLVGSNILTTLISHPSIAHTSAFTRRALPHTSNKLSTLPAEPSPDQDAAALWPTLIASATPAPSLYISALGTTLAQAGSAAAQRLVDYDLNLALARAARAAGVSTYVLVSTAGAATGSSFAYPRMKGELEEAVRALGFDHTVILRPGLIVGERADARPAEFVLRKVAGFAGCVGNGFKDFWAQDAEVIARAAVAAGVQCAEGKREKGVWEVAQKDIVRLGRTEWGVEEQK